MSAPRATTPARVTRSRANTPLPALQARQSHAYGAPGRASLTGQVTQSDAAVDQAFATTQQTRESTATAQVVRPRRGRPPKAQSHVSEESEEEANKDPLRRSTPKHQRVGHGDRVDARFTGEQERPETALQDSANYDSPAQMLPPATPRPRAFLPADPEPSYEPGYFHLYLRTLSRWLTSRQVLVFMLLAWLLLLGQMCLFGTIAAWAPLPARLQSTRLEFFRGLRYAVGSIGGDVGSYGFASPVLQLATNKWHHMRIESLEQTAGFANETIEELRRMLPMEVAMTEEDGTLAILPAFWEALLQKLQSTDAAPLWETFIHYNQAVMREAAHEAIDNVVEVAMDAFGYNHKFVTKEDFEQAIFDNAKYMEEHFSERLQGFQAHVIEEAKRAAIDVVQESPALQLAKGQLKVLAYSNLVQNMDSRMRETNYFSHGLGALIDPRYTSDTFHDLGYIERLGRHMIWKTGLSSFKTPPALPNPPIAALLSWEESTQCWCAVPSQDEKAEAQLAVKLGHEIFPKELIIEHIPASGTRDIRAAPQDFEVWAQVASAAEASRIKAELDQRVEYYYQFECGQPPNNEASWVCVYAGKYGIHASNYEQSFTLHTNAQDIGLRTDRVAVRVTKNWGADHTCLYRVRMTGSEEGPNRSEKWRAGEAEL